MPSSHSSLSLIILYHKNFFIASKPDAGRKIPHPVTAILLIEAVLIRPQIQMLSLHIPNTLLRMDGFLYYASKAI